MPTRTRRRAERRSTGRRRRGRSRARTAAGGADWLRCCGAWAEADRAAACPGPSQAVRPGRPSRSLDRARVREAGRLGAASPAEPVRAQVSHAGRPGRPRVRCFGAKRSVRADASACSRAGSSPEKQGYRAGRGWNGSTGPPCFEREHSGRSGLRLPAVRDGLGRAPRAKRRERPRSTHSSAIRRRGALGPRRAASVPGAPGREWGAAVRR